MKKGILMVVAVLASTMLFAQKAVEVSRDPEGWKILKGFLTQEDLATDTAFAWYPQGQKNFTPNADIVKQYSAQKDSINLVIFGGTWCHDTQNLLPNFMSTIKAAGIPDSRITLIGVDREKTTLFNLAEAFGVINVPTFIIMKNGKEIGRVVEYGRMGMPEKELAGVLSATGTK